MKCYETASRQIISSGSEDAQTTVTTTFEYQSETIKEKVEVNVAIVPGGV